MISSLFEVLPVVAGLRNFVAPMFLMLKKR